MNKPTIPGVTLKPKEERRIIRGHAWVYRNEVAAMPELGDGDVVDVFASNRRFVGRGFYQQAGGIAVRILTNHQNDIDGVFFHETLTNALCLREKLFPGSRVYRWMHGESDMLPGLVVDRYDTVAVAHSDCAFYQRCGEMLLETLLSFAGVESVLFRCQGGKQWAGKQAESLEIRINDIRVALSFDDSQKTGLFLDQRCNWPLVRAFASGAAMLDGYCYHGLWGLHAAQAGAATVIGVDTSADAINHARTNAALNGAAQCAFEQGDVETALQSGDRWDVIVLDPPAFAKNRSQSRKAAARYEGINGLAMNALNPGGVLVSCSCSHFISNEAFLEILKRAARRAGKQAQLIEMRGAAPDHPVLLSMPETAYLKCAVLCVG
ncbi:MAG TPA: class I SAM-dependent rRNA methyltransferase [Candidatus Hydrogenedentes bacterium]|nr:class I SAM-dependent rRNA methyltransferase [Candidatus Hydrogenedentota bacterium]